MYTAGSFKYGAAHFGAKFWYRESQAISKKLKTQEDRRKFRQGLKGDLDFINQLNIMNLTEELSAGDTGGISLLTMNEPVEPSQLLGFLKDAPPIKIFEVINMKKAEKISILLHRISTLAHFSQSMTDYFAQDDALEPALAVLCEALRDSPNVGSVLKKQSHSFLALAQCFQKCRSKFDLDAVFRRPSPSYKRRRSSSRSRRRGDSTKRSSPYPKGFCFAFQKSVGCKENRCPYKHECATCGSQDHGKTKCRKNRRSKSS